MSGDMVQEKRLVDQISELLGKHGYPFPRDWHNFVHQDAFISQDQGIQRFLINRYWRDVIGLYNESTLDVRQCLIDHGSIDDWLRLFEQGVIPCIIRNTQPKLIS